VCSCIMSVDFSLIFHDRLQCRISTKTAELKHTHPHCRKEGRRLLFPFAFPEISHTQCFHGDDTFCMVLCCACDKKKSETICF